MDRNTLETDPGSRAPRAADEASVLRLLEALGNTGPQPAGAGGAGQRIRVLRTALAQLTEDQHEVLRLRYLNQLGVAETAAKMDRSERAVRSLCVQALIRLREALGDAI